MVCKQRSTDGNSNLKFLCSYGGKILPRFTDGNLRYVGGHTRVLSVDRSISYAVLMVKLVEFCGSSVTLKCQLPNGDLETLISIRSDEDLANIVEEYDRASASFAHPLKIRAILSPPKSLKQISPASSSDPSINLSPYSSSESLQNSILYRPVRRTSSPPDRYPVGSRNGSGKACCYTGRFDGSPRFLYWGTHCNGYCH
ncbi:octicosapeptide/Phox/Bem1p (PB1) domain-containing protein [Quillaja saponaria]|uniref:Octicosapeptide/Phox/Bem1p (PB1) domain-containing protein n=1 Tax=Quillaja saponaria TaxID=32244 RepID=A0AAD7LDL3_QUISA|nr:octicosapeptide/Phox/Bem1p (PB1) domain-containing protein [Quillaja saponaria]KAJ7956178.1 octicosapeptide/Phox/Bem1p (PB1) domain-containing protein [Quillaja saponaria]